MSKLLKLVEQACVRVGQVQLIQHCGHFFPFTICNASGPLHVLKLQSLEWTKVIPNLIQWSWIWQWHPFWQIFRCTAIFLVEAYEMTFWVLKAWNPARNHEWNATFRILLHCRSWTVMAPGPCFLCPRRKPVTSVGLRGMELLRVIWLKLCSLRWYVSIVNLIHQQ